MTDDETRFQRVLAATLQGDRPITDEELAEYQQLPKAQRVTINRRANAAIIAGLRELLAEELEPRRRELLALALHKMEEVSALDDRESDHLLTERYSVDA